jgi:hypothetical protein
MTAIDPISREWDLAHDEFCRYGMACSIHGKPGDRAIIYRAAAIEREQ